MMQALFRLPPEIATGARAAIADWERGDEVRWLPACDAPAGTGRGEGR
jgi:hypothetical protein